MEICTVRGCVNHTVGKHWSWLKDERVY